MEIHGLTAKILTNEWVAAVWRQSDANRTLWLRDRRARPGEAIPRVAQQDARQLVRESYTGAPVWWRVQEALRIFVHDGAASVVLLASEDPEHPEHHLL